MDPNSQPHTPQPPLSDDEPARNEQSSNSSEFISAPETPDAFGPHPHDVAQNVYPENEYPTPLLPNQPVADTTTVFGTTAPKRVAHSPWKKSRLWLWLTLGAVSLVCIGLVAGFFVVKGTDNASARAYTTDAKGYVDDIYTDITVPATTPTDVNSRISSKKAPVLKPALLKGVSSEYQTAETLKNDITTNVGNLTTKINGYANTDVFYKAYNELYSNLQLRDPKGAAILASHNKTAITAYLSEFLIKLQDINKLIKGTTVPTELDKDFKELGRVYDGMSTNWSAMTSAYGSDNVSAYDDAYTKYKLDVQELGRAKQPVIYYADDLTSKIQTAVKEFKTYKDTVK